MCSLVNVVFYVSWRSFIGHLEQDISYMEKGNLKYDVCQISGNYDFETVLHRATTYKPLHLNKEKPMAAFMTNSLQSISVRH